MAPFVTVFNPNNPVANTWTYTFYYDDLTTLGPAFIPEVITGGNPAITFSAQSNSNAVAYFSEGDRIHNLAVQAVNSLGVTFETYFDVTILPFKTITAPTPMTYYYQVDDPLMNTNFAIVYSVDISTTEVWTYTVAGAPGPITSSDRSPTTGGVDFHTFTNDDAEAGVYTLTVTATLDTGETNSDYIVTIVIQRINPPIVPDVLYYVRDPTYAIEIPQFEIYP